MQRDDLEALRRTAFAAGYAHALYLAAQRVDELDAIWRPIERPAYEQVVAARVAEMEQWGITHSCDDPDRRQWNTGTGRRWNTWFGCYPGGPVDFDTGQLAGAAAGAAA